MTNISQPGSIPIAQLTGNEIVSLNSGPVWTSATVRQIADLSGSQTGNTWYVNATTGSDTNPGTATQPFATLSKAQTAAVANNGDVVYLTGTVHLTATLAWAKADVSLIGLNSPSNNARARISATGATAFSPLVNVTGAGCSFINLGTFHGGFTGATGSQVCWNEAGGRNFYSDVQFFGGGDTTTAALAGMRSLTITGLGENIFSGCTIGLDTILRATNTNASLEFLSGTARNVFYNPIFQSYISDTADVHVLCAANGADRYQYMFDPIFANAVDSGSSTMAAAVTWAGGSPAGGLIISGGISVGATAVATTGPVYTNMAQANAAGVVAAKLT